MITKHLHNLLYLTNVSFFEIIEILFYLHWLRYSTGSTVKLGICLVVCTKDLDLLKLIEINTIRSIFPETFHQFSCNPIYSAIINNCRKYLKQSGYKSLNKLQSYDFRIVSFYSNVYSILAIHFHQLGLQRVFREGKHGRNNNMNNS